MMLYHLPPDGRGMHPRSFVYVVTDPDTGRSGRVRVNPYDGWHNLSALVDSRAYADLKHDDSWALERLCEMRDAIP